MGPLSSLEPCMMLLAISETAKRVNFFLYPSVFVGGAEKSRAKCVMRCQRSGIHARENSAPGSTAASC